MLEEELAREAKANGKEEKLDGSDIKKSFLKRKNEKSGSKVQSTAKKAYKYYIDNFKGATDTNKMEEEDCRIPLKIQKSRNSVGKNLVSEGSQGMNSQQQNTRREHNLIEDKKYNKSIENPRNIMSDDKKNRSIVKKTFGFRESESNNKPAKASAFNVDVVEKSDIKTPPPEEEKKPVVRKPFLKRGEGQQCLGNKAKSIEPVKRS